RDAGLHWTSLGFNARTNGTKAVSVAMLPISNAANAPETLTVFLSHSIYGTAYIQPDSTNPVWIDMTNGFEALSTLDNMDEVSDILAVQERQSNGTYKTEVYFTQSFLPRLYRLNWAEKKAELIAQSSEPLNTWDSLTQVGSDLAFVTMNDTIRFFSPTSETFIDTQKSSAKRAVSDILKKSKTTPNCAWLPSSITGISNAFGLSELWMTDTQGLSNKYSRFTEDKRSLYVPSSELRTQAGMTKYIDTLKENNLNSLVVDMKDDKGVLRYQSEDPLVKEKAFTSRYALDIENFIQTFKNNDIYLIARIVVFKDPNLYAYNNGKYAVWDNTTNAPWLGIRGYTEEQTATYYDEQWVDPYSHEVWEYNVAIAKELIALGFDEIQFDYIRFPTDGYNLDNASYRWQDAGMEKESALVSFLSYARKNIQAPIGVDIYGVNGWYRSGSRTGQEVELLAPYVDVICPMFYPSHFEQYFLAYEPIAERPYRIYFYGTYRNAVIARNKVLIRPWLQSFYLNVSYDREFYDSDYVQRQVFGVRDATDTGYMYWNNVGRYDEVRPDIGTAQENTPYPWKKATHEEIDSIPVFLNN
ncbi:MAG: putative glycoside hydrolase, partial [Spirochaetales bacterium]